MAATGRSYWSAKRSSRICSKHFLPTCFAEGEGKSLLDDAVPTEVRGESLFIEQGSNHERESFATQSETNAFSNFLYIFKCSCLQFVKTRPPGSPMTVLTRLILEEYLERNNIDESAEVSESEVMNVSNTHLRPVAFF